MIPAKGQGPSPATLKVAFFHESVETISAMGNPAFVQRREPRRHEISLHGDRFARHAQGHGARVLASSQQIVSVGNGLTKAIVIDVAIDPGKIPAFRGDLTRFEVKSGRNTQVMPFARLL